MADQKNASFLYYLRSFLKQGDGTTTTPRNKRKDADDGSNFGSNLHSSFENSISSTMMVVADEDNDVALSHSNKRMRSSER
eukprot:CAMPEP_0116140222 /NCGR_PEP_ID=MMETSP0329-20121206/13724_1 /TAXON_ID=697910 /ORGANISM="Pseudo-nitzschia arenysensis, Strain B593" /LENGTH=80 /DNA_ID=CAMNT_0003635305 /DNA_START=167 /DNA_END=409 /DNA_ORIENTATION=+